MPESSDVLLEEAGLVVIIRIDDGKVNAFTEELLSSFRRRSSSPWPETGLH